MSVAYELGDYAEQCPACGDGNSRPLPSYNGYEMRSCASCALAFTHRRNFPSEQYEDVYRSQGAYRLMLSAAEDTAAGKIGYRELWWFKRMALRLLDRLAQPGSLVDIGSGPGTFLMVARQRGWQVQGIEAAHIAANTARRLGIDTFTGTVQDYRRTADRRFDAATCFEVLEHVPDVPGHLEATRDILRPGGILVMSVPNLDDPYCLRQMIASTTPPVHINFFNRQSLSRAFERAGMEVLRFRTLPVPTSSVRNVHGRNGFVARLPYLAWLKMRGRADGTVLTVAARRPAT